MSLPVRLCPVARACAAAAVLVAATGTAWAASAPASTNFDGGLPADWAISGGLYVNVADGYVALDQLLGTNDTLSYTFNLGATSDVMFSFWYTSFSTANNTVFTVGLDANPAAPFGRTNAGGGAIALGIQGATYLAANPGPGGALNSTQSPDQVFNGLAAGDHTITFTMLGGNLHAAKIDNFSISAVTAVPEPETYAMMLAGLGALGFMARRRRAK